MPKKLRCYLRRHRWETKRGADNTTYNICLDCGAIRDPQMSGAAVAKPSHLQVGVLGVTSGARRFATRFVKPS
jgi:hypothetical protein